MSMISFLSEGQLQRLDVECQPNAGLATKVRKHAKPSCQAVEHHPHRETSLSVLLVASSYW